MREYKDIKVALLTHSFIRWKGDFAGVFLLDLAKGLITSGIKVFVIAPHEGKLLLYERIDGIDVYRVRYAPTKFERLAYRGNMHELVAKSFINKIIFLGYTISFFIKAMALAGKVDIIHAHWWVPSGIIALIVSKLSRRPYVVTSHGSDIFILEKFKFLRVLAEIVFKNANSITVVSTKLKSILIHELGIEANKINVFPMPCDFSLFYPTTVEKDERKVVLSIGRLIELKGYNYLIDAADILKKRGIKFKLIIIGEGPEEQSLKTKTHALGLDEEVEFLGFKPKADLNYFYNMCDVFVLPSITGSDSREEGLGLVLLEAMSCKKPVIGTNSGGIPDIIKDSETGLLVPEKDPDALANAIERLLNDKELATRLAENGYKYVLDNFTTSKIANRVKEIYLKCIK